MESDPISVIFVKSDSKGDRLLFRYPFAVKDRSDDSLQNRRKNPYALTITEDLLLGPPPKTLNASPKGTLSGFTDEVLSNMFAVKQELCDGKFELKANHVRFVGHPTLLQPCLRRFQEPDQSIILINIVFALQASASHSIVKCYYELSKRLGVALRHEEKRCCYVSHEMKAMIAVHDRTHEDQAPPMSSPYEDILEFSCIAKDLKEVYDKLCGSGIVHLRVNKWIELSFCLPQKVHQLQNKALFVDPEGIDRCLQSVRPYHGLLLLVDTAQLMETLVPDSSPALTRLLRIYTPLKSLQTLSADADLTLAQVFNLAGHMVYWGKAIIIYPLCETNVYMTAPNAPIHINSPLIEKFAEQFPTHSLIQVMSEFSLPISIREKLSPLALNSHNDVQIIVWLLQHRLLLQLHTYIYYMPTSRGFLQEKGGSTDGCGSCGASTPEESLSLSELSSSLSEDGPHMPPLLSWVNDSGEDCLSQLSSDQRAAILNTPATPDDLKLLVRLILEDYLHGEHHLEEIMYLENVRRSQLLQLLDKFRDVLVTCQSEDPALSLFYPHTY